MEIDIEKLKKELELARHEDSERFIKAPPGMNLYEFEKYMSVTSDKVQELSQKYRLVQEPVFTELSTYGHVMTLTEFIESVKTGGFIDYDGFGLYVRDGLESDITILPSDVYSNMVRNDFDTIFWFNR